MPTDYNPPNLFRWVDEQAAERIQGKGLIDFKNNLEKPRFKYLQGAGDCVSLGAWLLLCGRGGFELAVIFGAPGWLCFVAVTFALLADWCEAALNHEMVFVPLGREFGYLSAVANFLLELRLCAVAVVLFGTLSLFFAVRHYIPLQLNSSGWHLAVLDVMLLFLCFSKEWCATSMIESGLGSIFRLQKCMTPGSVERRLRIWSKGGQAYLLQPVTEALTRDILGLVPTYIVVFTVSFEFLCTNLCQGTGVAPWLGRFGSWLISHSFGIACTMVAGAAANVLEDLVRCVWVNRFPEHSPPGWSVGLADILMAAKSAMFLFGLSLSFLAVWSLCMIVVVPLQLTLVVRLALGILVLVPVILNAAVWVFPRRDSLHGVK